MESPCSTSGTTLSTVQILIAARRLIFNEKNWTRESRARNKKSRRVPPLSPKAVKWCAEGAARRVAGVGTMNLIAHDEAVTALNASSQALYRLPISQANDTHGHRAALAVYDFTIHLLTPKT